jgi:hypothetical protein
MAPPVFLSEEEALQVIREEMAAKGVQLGTNQTTVAGVTVERARFSVSAAPSAPSTGATNERKPAGFTFEMRQETFKADAADPKKKVFVEFLSRRDADQWELERQRETGDFHGSTVQSYDLTNTAAYLDERVKQQATDQIYFGTFYDPMAAKRNLGEATTEEASSGKAGSAPASESRSDGIAESRRLLRLQVQDFLKWLQAQGAI